MCGVFGYIAQGGEKPNLERLQRIAEVTERRGPHAFGLAWVDSRGRLRSYKQTGKISDHLGLLAMAADARMLIGHCRYATQGDYHNNLNNHPFACDGGWIVHNGMIPDYREIIEERELYPVTDCDSEVLALLVEEFDGTLGERCAKAVGEVERAAVMLGLWTHPTRLIAVKNGNPLQMGFAKSGIYLASLPAGLPKQGLRSLPDSCVLEFNEKNGKVRIHERRIEGLGQRLQPAGAADGVCPLSHDADAEGEAGGVRRGAWFE